LKHLTTVEDLVWNRVVSLVVL